MVAAAWSPDSRYLATGGGDKSIRIWAINNVGRPAQVYEKAHAADIEFIVFVPGTNRIVSVGEDGMMKVWDGFGGGELLAVAAYGAAVSSRIRQLAGTPDRKALNDALNLLQGGAMSPSAAINSSPKASLWPGNTALGHQSD